MHEPMASGWLMNYLAHSALLLAIFGAVAWLGDRILRKAGPQAQHRLWVAALLAGVGLPLLPVGLLTSCFGHADVNSIGNTATVTYQTIAAAVGRWTAPPLLCAVVAAGYLLTVLLAMARLLWQWRRTRAMARRAAAVHLGGLACRLLEDAVRRFGVTMPEVRCSPETRGPVVLGLRRAVLLAPEGFFQTENAEDIAAAVGA